MQTAVKAHQNPSLHFNKSLSGSFLNSSLFPITKGQLGSEILDLKSILLRSLNNLE